MDEKDSGPLADQDAALCMHLRYDASTSFDLRIQGHWSPTTEEVNAIESMVHHRSRGVDNGFVRCAGWKATASLGMWKTRWKKRMA